MGANSNAPPRSRVASSVPSPRVAGAFNHAVRTSAGRGDARGVGYRKTCSFLRDCHVVVTTPLPFIPCALTQTFRLGAESRARSPRPAARARSTTLYERPRGEGMQGEWGTEEPARFFAIALLSPSSRPHSPSSPRPVRIGSVRPFDWEHGARGPGTRRSFREPSSLS
jgi:hypothetical protein